MMIRCCFSGVQTGGHTHSSGCTEMTEPPDVPAAAPLAADTPSKALPNWTMMALDPGSQRMADQLQKYINEIYQYAQPSYFIPANTWLPPLAAQPAETKLTCGGCEAFEEIGEHSPVCPVELKKAKPAPQPAPACAYGCSDVTANTACPTHGKPAPAKPVCSRCSYDTAVHNVAFEQGLIKLCFGCEDRLNEWRKAQTGTPYTGPERLERPKLAHQSQWADEAEDVR
jgi:hypothetical protein